MTLKEYFDNSIGAFDIPDISKGFIPQGIAYDPQSDLFFLTGYMGNSGESRIYITDRKNRNNSKRILLTTGEGRSFKGHAGGASVYGNSIYIAGSTDSCFYVLKTQDVLNAGNGTGLNVDLKTDLKSAEDYIRASFTSVDDTLLYVGEFHKGWFFYTNKNHAAEYDGVRQKAYLLGTRIDDDGNAVPDRVYSIPDCIQGACFADDCIFLSQSNGFFPGRILSYSIGDLRQSGQREVLGKNIPEYALTERSAKKVSAVPPMPEEIIVVDDRMYITYESASNRYLIGKVLGLDRIISTPVEFFK